MSRSQVAVSVAAAIVATLTGVQAVAQLSPNLELTSEERGTLLDLALVECALEQAAVLYPDDTPEVFEWRSVEGWVGELDPAVFGEVPAEDRWGGRILIRSTSSGAVVLSPGPDGIPDDLASVEEVVFGGRTEGCPPRSDTGDDIVWHDRSVIQGPVPPRVRWAQTVADMRTLGVAIALYLVDGEANPALRPGLLEVDSVAELLAPVYLRWVPCVDGWGYPLRARVDDDGSFVVVSYGSNGTPERDWGALSLSDLRPDEVATLDDPASDLALVNGTFLALPDALQYR